MFLFPTVALLLNDVFARSERVVTMKQIYWSISICLMLGIAFGLLFSGISDVAIGTFSADPGTVREHGFDQALYFS